MSATKIENNHGLYNALGIFRLKIKMVSQQ